MSFQNSTIILLVTSQMTQKHDFVQFLSNINSVDNEVINLQPGQCRRDHRSKEHYNQTSQSFYEIRQNYPEKNNNSKCIEQL